MELGTFSVSRAVEDLARSRESHEKRGFTRTGGGDECAIPTSGGTIIGPFHKMFEDNILTNDPGLTNDLARIGDPEGNPILAYRHFPHPRSAPAGSTPA